MPPKIERELAGCGAPGRLHIHAGRVLPMRGRRRAIEVSWRLRGANRAPELQRRSGGQLRRHRSASVANA